MPRKIIKSRYFVEDEAVETVSEVSTEKHEDWQSNENLKYVGKQISRKDGYDKVVFSLNLATWIKYHHFLKSQFTTVGDRFSHERFSQWIALVNQFLWQ